MTGLRLMAVHAHPDDEASKGAATTARYAAEGNEVMVVTLTGGERGDILNPAMDRPEVAANIGAIRREEMAKAAAELGVRHRWLGYVDSGLPQGARCLRCHRIRSPWCRSRNRSPSWSRLSGSSARTS